jgi:hypothetical protein
MPIVQSLPSQVSIEVPVGPTPIIDMIVVLPEVSNKFFVAMAQLIPYYVYNSSTEFTVPEIESVAVRGTATPGSTIIVLVNNVNQSPTTSIVADATGGWSTTIVLNPGPSLIRAQYYVP